jgi:hypothetical protein
MKTKNISKKLTLDKRTITDLDFNGMRQIKGMGTELPCNTQTCKTIDIVMCPETSTEVPTWGECW